MKTRGKFEMNNLERIQSTGFWKLQRTEYKYQYEFFKKIHDKTRKTPEFWVSIGLTHILVLLI